MKGNRLIFLDESGYRLGSCLRYGWSPRSERAFGFTDDTGGWETMTMIGAMGIDEVHGFMTFDCGTSAQVFDSFIEHQLVEHLLPGDSIIMDNLAAHKNAAAVKRIEATGARVVFLPPYSPDLNPIEKLWSKLKEILRTMKTSTRELFDEAVKNALLLITADDLKAWTTHCGYEISSS